MDPLAQNIHTIIQSSLLKDEKKSELFISLEKTGITEDFFKLLKKLILEEANERKVLFLEGLEKWDIAYATLVNELITEEQKIDDTFAQQLIHIDPYDILAKNQALQKYTQREKFLYEAYQKKLTTLGISHAQQALEKISSAQ